MIDRKKEALEYFQKTVELNDADLNIQANEIAELTSQCDKSIVVFGKDWNVYLKVVALLTSKYSIPFILDAKLHPENKLFILVTRETSIPVKSNTAVLCVNANILEADVELIFKWRKSKIELDGKEHALKKLLSLIASVAPYKIILTLLTHPLNHPPT